MAESGDNGGGRLKRNEKGSSRGSVISPLLANIYLNALDTWWERNGTEGRRLVRYADDMEDMIRELNPKITGWRNYYGVKMARKWLNGIDWYIIEAFTRWNSRKRQKKSHINNTVNIQKKSIVKVCRDRQHDIKLWKEEYRKAV